MGLVHRDVKPGNVLLTSFHEQTDHVYLTDFGLTKRASSLTGGLTGTGHFLGTIDYVAPEQIAGKPVDARTDIYALGCVLYECLTGRVPFHRDDDAATLWAHLVDSPPPVTGARSDLAPAVDEVISRAMAKAPEDRYDSCHELVRALKVALELAAPVRGGRLLAGVDTSPVGRVNLEHDQETRAPAEHPSFPPGSLPPGPRPSGARPPAHRAHEPDLDEQEYADSGEPPDGGEGEPPYVTSGDGAGEAGPAPARAWRAFLRRRRWHVIAAVAALAGLAAAGIILLPGNASPKLSHHYSSGHQFAAVVAPFGVDTPADWVSVDDPFDVDVALSPGGQTMADLFSPSGSNGSWDPVRGLLKSNRSKAAGVWIHAEQNVPDRSSWQNLQAAVRAQLPAAVQFNGGYQPRTVGGMAADEMDGDFDDPADAGASLHFVIDVVQYRTPTLTSSVWVVFFAAPDKFSGRQPVFDRVRTSIAFK